ncbi:MAG: ribbon-helix-helix protein, CopG family [Chlamydiae bacterium]|nr:ribbon-helix-helix protein, CopG family [Chlamydiota bacterium]MBI3266841.1 ribbon-helix-helix protein, CopG family [Chlamydiota bacterium]
MKTSITLSEDLLKLIDHLTGKSMNRSELIELALREYLLQRAKRVRDSKDLELINRHADRLNKQVQDTLSFQIPI